MRALSAVFLLVSGTALAAGYQEVTVTNGGTISGKVTYDGTPPKPKQITITQDPSVCGTSRLEDAWSIAPDGGVENVVVYLVDIAAGKKMTAPAQPVLDQKGCHYVPQVQVIAVGSELQIKSSDPILHNVHSYQGQGGATVINFAMPKQGMVIPKKMKKAGGETLKCDIHNFMRGVIFVIEHPYYAITAKDGTFKITDVPAGSYQVSTFHEVAGSKTASVTVTAGGTATFSPKIK